MATAVEAPPADVKVEPAKAPVIVPPEVKVEAKTEPAKVEAKADAPASLLADAPDAKTKVEPAKADAPAEWKLAAPKDSGLTADHVKAVEKFARDHAMTEAQAQKIIERDAAAKVAITSESETQRTSTIKATNDAWIVESKAKFGDKLNDVVSNAKRALAVYDKTGAVTKMLKDTAMGSNPAVLEFLSFISAASREDAPAGGTSAAPKTIDPVRAFYGDDHRKPSSHR